MPTSVHWQRVATDTAPRICPRSNSKAEKGMDSHRSTTCNWTLGGGGGSVVAQRLMSATVPTALPLDHEYMSIKAERH